MEATQARASVGSPAAAWRASNESTLVTSFADLTPPDSPSHHETRMLATS